MAGAALQFVSAAAYDERSEPLHERFEGYPGMMGESKPTRHPLFDPASTYSRMRSSARPEYKMRGYFHWQKARAIRLGASPPEREPGQEEERQSALRLLAHRMAALGGAGIDFRVTDVLPVVTDCFPLGRPEREGFSGSLVLVAEADGAHTVGLWLETHGPTREDDRSACRAFLIEPEVLKRLQDVVQEACKVEPNRALGHAFLAETVAGSLDVARLLAALPDLDGEARGPLIHFRRLPLAADFEVFPPRQGPLTVALVFDDPLEGPG
jgi:hypothetical protein